MVLFYFVLRVKQEVYYRWFDRLKREKRCLQITQQRNDDRFIQAVVQKLICILHNKRLSDKVMERLVDIKDSQCEVTQHFLQVL